MEDWERTDTGRDERNTDSSAATNRDRSRRLWTQVSVGVCILILIVADVTDWLPHAITPITFVLMGPLILLLLVLDTKGRRI